MEISTTASPKSPETLSTPTARIHPNGLLKRHLSPPPPAYKECLKNHAASRGGLSLDGCCEFMPDPASSLNCAACGCHRNFHRRLSTPSPSPDPPLYQPQHRHRLPPPPTPNSPSPPPISSSYYHHNSTPHMLIPLAGGNSAPPQHHHHHHQANTAPFGRKRFRTKFTQEQKEKMLGFAAKIGWKMQRCNDDLVAQFCGEIGVERGVFKVWMHNNKNHFVKRDLNVDFGTNGSNNNGVGANGSSSTS